MSEVCGDNRFELIGEFKGKLVEGTNIESSPEEMAVLDNFLFRIWQMGWLDKLKAQEPVEVDEWPDEFLCPTCRTRLAGRSHDDCILLETNDTPNYCWVCGQAVRWG